MQPNPFTREDTLLGVCQAIGEDVGFNPLFLRIGFGVLLFWNIGAAIATYLALGAVVLAIRLAMPVRRAPAVIAEPAPLADNDAAADDLRIAA